MVNEAALLERAWSIIANSYAREGGWEAATEDWRRAAETWRDTYHAWLSGHLKSTSNWPEPKVVRQYVIMHGDEHMTQIGSIDEDGTFAHVSVFLINNVDYQIREEVSVQVWDTVRGIPGTESHVAMLIEIISANEWINEDNRPLDKQDILSAVLINNSPHGIAAA